MLQTSFTQRALQKEIGHTKGTQRELGNSKGTWALGHSGNQALGHSATKALRYLRHFI